MAVSQPEPFDNTFCGPTGAYRPRFRPDGGEGRLEVTMGALDTAWIVRVCEREGDPWRLGGLTEDTDAVWRDTYWFSLLTASPRPDPPC